MNNLSNDIKTVLNDTGFVITGFSGKSMLPMLRCGKDKVVIEKITKPLKLHDVPLYKIGDGRLVLHRIIKIGPTGFTVRGDNLYFKEFGVKDSDIIGVLKGFYRDDKYVDCSKCFSYKLYVFYIRLSYPVRFLLFKVLRPFLSKIKRFFKKK